MLRQLQGRGGLLPGLPALRGAGDHRGTGYAPTPEKFHVIHLNNGGGFREAMEAIHHGLLEAGHDSILTGMYQFREFPDRRKINFSVKLGKTLRERYPDTDWRELIGEDDIFYNAEQLRDKLMETSELDEIVRERVIWDYSVRNIEYLRRRGCRKAIFAPLGYVDALRRIPRHEYDTDVMFYGLVNPRRQVVLDALRESRLRCRFYGQGQTVWGEERDDLIGRAKIVLNIHFHEQKIFEVFRTFYPLLNGKCVVSETGGDANEEPYRGGVVLCDYEDIVETCLRYANDNRLLRAQEERAAATMRSFRQADILRRALAES